MTEAIPDDVSRKILIVGPLPPPIGGSSLTVQMMMAEMEARYSSLRVSLVNTSPSRDPRKKMTGFNLEKVRRMILIVLKFTREIRSCDAVIVFANNLFAISIVPVLLLLARTFDKSLYIKPVGGDLDLYVEAQKKPVRMFLLSVLRATDGLFVQTRLLQAALSRMGCSNTHYLPGFRSQPRIIRKESHLPDELKLIFLAHIARDKGSLILLEALQKISRTCDMRVSCDFYGPIHEDISDEFFRQLSVVPNVQYCGIAEAGIGSQLIATYDVLVLPTFFSCEGHPGVIIEAMHAGVPVISTKHRSIPELVTNGDNGILVPVKDSHALAMAIKQFAMDRSLQERMGQANYHRGQEYYAEVVVAKMLKLIFP